MKVVRQNGSMDCGVCCLLSVIRHYGGNLPIEYLREMTATDRNGVSAYNLVHTAQEIGFSAYGVRGELTDISSLDLPIISHVILNKNLKHFVVIYKIDNIKRKVMIMDPAKGKRIQTFAEFSLMSSNNYIILKPIDTLPNIRVKKYVKMWFKNFSKSNITYLAYIVIFSLLSFFLSIVCGFHFSFLLNNAINYGIENNVLKISMLILVIYVFKEILFLFRNLVSSKFSILMDEYMTKKFYNKLLLLPYMYYKNRTTGEIVTRIDELSNTKNLFSEIFATLILNTILIFGAIVTLFLINSKLFFLLCFIIIIYLIVGLLFSKVIYHKVKENIETTTNFNTTLIENVDMNFSIKNLNLVREFIYRIENKLILMLKSNFSFMSILNVIELLKNFIYEVGLFMITTLGIYLIYKGELELLSLVTFNSVILYLFNPVKKLVDLMPKYNYLKASFSKLSEFLATEIEKEQGGLKHLIDPNIEVKDLTYSYDLFNKIINKVNFAIKSKEKVLLSGPSGSGKSTICKLIYRSLGTYSGNIEFNNTSECDYSLKAIRENILYVGQNEKLFTGTIRENIICFRNISDEKFKQVCKICKLEEIINKRPNRYNTIINASLNNLSGGEKQRIILARALLKKAKIIILDEALSEVNVNMEKEILDNIFTYFKNNTLIYVTHKNVEDKFTKIIRLGELC